jgi:hypothetical protein
VSLRGAVLALHAHGSGFEPQQCNKQTYKAKKSTNNSQNFLSVFMLPFSWVSIFFGDRESFTILLVSDKVDPDSFCSSIFDVSVGGQALRDANSLLMFWARSQKCLNVGNKIWFWLAG